MEAMTGSYHQTGTNKMQWSGVQGAHSQVELSRWMINRSVKACALYQLSVVGITGTYFLAYTAILTMTMQSLDYSSNVVGNR